MKRKGHITSKRHRSKDAQTGDRVIVLLADSLFTDVEATVRNTYHDVSKDGYVISVVVHVSDAPDAMKKMVPVAPDGGYHTILRSVPAEFEVIGRRIQA